MRDTAHNILVRESGHCPWCGGDTVLLRDECPEPDGAALVKDPWDDDEEQDWDLDDLGGLV